MGRELDIELFQTHVIFGPHEDNRSGILARLAGSRADLCLFPEASTSGFCYDDLARAALANADFLPVVQAEARRLARGVCLPLLYPAEEAVVNRTFLISPMGELIGHYDKIHLIGILNEDRYLRPGAHPVVLEYPAAEGIVRVGLATCYDLRFPELYRHLALVQAADLFLVPAMWPVERIEHFGILTRARALENLTPLVACNAVGPCGALSSGGASCVVSAWGELVFSGAVEAQDAFVFHYVSEDTAEARRRLPALGDAGRVPLQVADR